MFMSIGMIANTAAGSSATDQDARLKEACQEFEAFFWMELLKAARRSIDFSGENRSSQSNFYTDLLDQQYALLLARQDTAGLGKMLYEQLCSKETER
ncbi:MAG TPA: hypothetical protein GX502_02585 [Syntrophaceticus sp.]|nr:hypothetical protein [Syntrophaceticus sp.]